MNDGGALQSLAVRFVQEHKGITRELFLPHAFFVTTKNEKAFDLYNFYCWGPVWQYCILNQPKTKITCFQNKEHETELFIFKDFLESLKDVL